MLDSTYQKMNVRNGGKGFSSVAILLAVGSILIALGVVLYNMPGGNLGFAPARMATTTSPMVRSARDISMIVPGARVGGVDIPNRKRLEVSLQSIYGVGKATAKSIISSTGIENKRVYELEEDELTKIRSEVDKYVTEGDLRRQIRQDIARLIDIQCFRGKRHQAGLPCRGQNTKNNARTRKRNRHVKI
mmetsp:Transcript_19012/g.26519  ORF Transcript_19012/g.26519 Transcript_19012/m.26519 type:complete len:189 (-) Transcript_19012:267-833(-)|eukprot:CAMPEP_0184486244 /NCGR_PEP_ID=MMETSP0113_2-20130426/7767_1 /TAXON_ID=91329 /ORGANISM="Norrisiella sphaerica, Strain BC52" /LENGTH=188 /DNA_ID=CAMNT_0026868027 /DNA_START=54 /DNA_END=620 /DNA_ORIENTATION=+